MFNKIKVLIMKCSHTYKKRKMPPRYITDKFLMCGICKGKIRKLNSEDRERMNFANALKYLNFTTLPTEA